MRTQAATPPPSPFSLLDPVRRKLAYERAAQRVKEVREVAIPALQALHGEITFRRNVLRLEEVPPVMEPFRAPSRYKGAHSGRGGSKSWTFGKMLLARCIKQKGLRCVCIREVQKSLEQSVKRLLEDLIEMHGLGHLFKILNTHIETPGGGIIIFQGMQNHTAESIKSLEGYDIAWVEEAQSLSERSLMLLRPTIRKPGSELWFTWNPRRPTDPIDKFLRSDVTPPDSLVIGMSYKDNPYLPEVLKAEIAYDQQRDPDKYQHVWLGGYERHSEARVFKNWIVDAFEPPAEVISYLFGGDWGYATDPSVCVRGYVRPSEPKRLYIDAEVYRVGCEVDDTPALFDQLGCVQRHEHGVEGECDKHARPWQIITDSARPETISYMQRHGYPRVIGAKKGPGSIEEGIQFLKSYDIVVHPRCTHVIDELTMYCFKKDPLTDVIIPVLSEKKNHTIDSLRYMIEAIRNPVESWVTW